MNLTDELCDKLCTAAREKSNDYFIYGINCVILYR